MANKQATVDITKIIAEIRAEIREKGLNDDLPGFKEVGIVDYSVITQVDINALRQRVQTLMDNCQVSAVYSTEGNAIKRFYKKLIYKATRCVTGPMALRMSDTNHSITQCMNSMVNIIDQQQKQINELSTQMKQICEALNGEVEGK